MAASDRHFALGAANCPGDWVRTKSHAQIENALRARCRHIEATAPPKQKTTIQAPTPTGTQQAAARQPDGAANQTQQSGSCSDITGTGGESSPGNCTPSNGVPPNVQAQINQARSYMQAAKTVKQSDASYSGWSTAAQQFRKAEAAFKAAGDLANAAAASDQALTLENALKIADQKSNPGAAASQPQPSSQPNLSPVDQASNSCPPLGPASYWQNTPNAAYCASANCVERASAYYGMMCFPQDQSSGGRPTSSPTPQQQAAVQPQATGPIPDANSLRAQQGSCSDITGLGGGGPTNCQPSSGQGAPRPPTLANAAPSQTVSQPASLSPGAITVNFSNAIQSLADAVADTSDDDLRARLLRRLERTLADHRVPVKPQDYACLQPASAANGKPKLIDVPLRWTEYGIKHDAIDRSHLCDNVGAGDAKQACREEKFGQAVMWAEPELAGLCRADGGPSHDIDKVAECARRKFLNAWAKNDGIVQEAPPEGWASTSECASSAPAAKRKQAFHSHLRDLLLAALAARDAAGGDGGESGSNVSAGNTDPTAAIPSPPLPAAPSSDDNEAYCTYMARQVVRGELTPGAGTPIPAECKAAIAAAEAMKKQQQANNVPPFSMSDVETDKEIKQLLKGPSAQ